jgi:hypothetical protein
MRDQVLKDRLLMAAALLLTAALATWAAISISGKSWLYALVIAALGAADLPLVAAVRRGRGRIVALLVHTAVLVVAWFIAFAVWAPFVDWE